MYFPQFEFPTAEHTLWRQWKETPVLKEWTRDVEHQDAEQLLGPWTIHPGLEPSYIELRTFAPCCTNVAPCCRRFEMLGQKFDCEAGEVRERKRRGAAQAARFGARSPTSRSIVDICFFDLF